jgi:anti-sigma factor RsiW
MECLDEGLIQAYIDGEVAPNEVKEINSHLEKCPVCAKNVKLQKKISSDVLGSNESADE